jgi:hypothetical protein
MTPLATAAVPDGSKDVVERLRHAMATCANDDRSEPLTLQRERMVERLGAMSEAADEIERLRAVLQEVIKADARGVQGICAQLAEEALAATPAAPVPQVLAVLDAVRGENQG